MMFIRKVGVNILMATKKESLFWICPECHKRKLTTDAWTIHGHLYNDHNMLVSSHRFYYANLGRKMAIEEKVMS